MARVLKLDSVSDDIHRGLSRSFQSGHINFMIGSGASWPAIATAGSIEQEIVKLFDSNKEDDGYLKLYDFLTTIQTPTNDLLADAENAKNAETVGHYVKYLGIIEAILSERRTRLLPKQATIFTTNYDLFIEKASLSYPSLRLNDGFSRTPSLNGRADYSSRTFFTTTSSTGNLYNYKVDIPCINLIKLHGSLSWKRDGDNVLFSVEKKPILPDDKSPAKVREFVDEYAVVLPQTKKFRTTLMESTYYELLRIYANELDREGTLLIGFGFSFGDEHILGITRRALKNPTLRLVAFAFSDADTEAFLKRFDGYNNVEVIAPPAGRKIDFKAFNEILGSVLPALNEKKK
ncbi:SIR2 family protein [Steroidobacter agaridevorans]|uniref:SIR2 family protein n=1 Tax=Steroidobacter agaridevorans TaxID=2695856 RepID=UPI0013292390|nr:SIR2 family protein [Steroidobacter agaridevorans]GFE87808.1 hypothetical protein GCM10011488_27620 [Steroidobacter agaridevorans]